METDKVLLIDQSDIPYFRMFSKYGMENMNMTVVSRYGSSNPNALQYFYKFSKNMRKGKKRNIVRGIEYIIAYLRIFHLIKKEKFKVIHVQWAVIPKIDIIIFKILKKNTDKLVYTAHDVIPHIKSDKQLKLNEKLYRIPDRVIVHGEFCKKEVEAYYPEILDKVYIQYHGVEDKEEVHVSQDTIKKHSCLFDLSKDKIVFGFLGQINKYKGIDILIDSWKKVSNPNACLVIAGKTIDEYKNEFDSVLSQIKKYKNIYIYNSFFTDEEEEMFYSLCDVIVLPYRTASMSGVLFTAAKYGKTILTTDVGCIIEYLNHCQDYVFITTPDVDGISIQLKNIIEKLHKNNLKALGKEFSRIVYEYYDWNKIIKKVKEECYEIK